MCILSHNYCVYIIALILRACVYHRINIVCMCVLLHKYCVCVCACVCVCDCIDIVLCVYYSNNILYMHIIALILGVYIYLH